MQNYQDAPKVNTVGYFKTINAKLFGDLNHVPVELSKSYYPSMDGLRGISILSVILGHIGRDKSWRIYIDGSVGVDIFFILSGFLITTLLLKEKIVKGKISLKSFYIRRILRIIPVAYLYLLVVIVLNYYFDLKIPALSFLTSFTFFRNIPITNDWYTGHYWTLSTEEQFYIVVPTLLAFWPNRFIKIAAVMLVFVPVLQYVGFHNIGIFYTNRTIHIITMTFLAMTTHGALYILTGCLFSILAFKGVFNLSIFNRTGFLSLILILLAAVVHFPNTWFNIPYFSAVVFALLMGFVIVLNLNENNFLTLILSNPVLTRLGILSYSIYIWQQIFTYIQPWAGRFLYADNLFFNMVALLIVSCCSYYLYEQKFLKLKSHFKLV